MFHAIRSAVLIALVACAATATAQLMSVDQRTESIEIAGQESKVDLYLPGAGAFEGMAILAHGWTRTRERHRDLGRALSSAGIIAVVPDLPNMVDLWGNGEAVVELTQKLEAGALGLAPVARSAIVLIGTSAGGLATVIAASKLPGLAGWVGLDPVDRTGSGIHAAAQLKAPAVVLLADASACNLFGSGGSIARAVPVLVRSTKIEGASHCDFESPTNRFCTAMCGGSSSKLQGAARVETVRAALELLRGANPAIARNADAGGRVDASVSSHAAPGPVFDHDED